MTNNLKNGHIRNLDDSFRKYCFGAYGVYGVEGNYEIDGIFMWRGPDLSHYWKQHNSFEYFNFAKLDPNDEAVQKMTAEYWMNFKEDELVQGRKVYDAQWYR